MASSRSVQEAKGPPGSKGPGEDIVFIVTALHRHALAVVSTATAVAVLVMGLVAQTVPRQFGCGQ